MVDIGTEPSTAALREVIGAVESGAPAWLGAEGPTRVEVTGIEERPQSTLLRVRVETASATKPMIVKVPRAVPDRERAPSLVPPVDDPVVKSRLEHDALVAVAAHFRSLDDPRFGWLTAHQHLPAHGAVVVDQIDEPTLDHLLRAGPAGSHPSHDHRMLLRHLGGWLAEFHRVETRDMEPRGGRVDQLRSDLHRLRELLCAAGRARKVPGGLPHVIDEVLPAVLPVDMATGLGHGDFAPRNVFVSEHGRITVIDSLGRFRVPVHEDAAYLLTELATGATRFARRRRPPASAREIDGLRSAFLAGYPMADDPTLWAFELRALLDKLRSLAGRRPSTSPAGRAKGATDGLRERFVARRARLVCEKLVASC